MIEWLKLPKTKRGEILNRVAELTGLPIQAIEKDWWVTLTLHAIFSLPYSGSIVFKGGTSLSKAWGLIERFSEDIDLTLDKEYLGFKGDISISQIKKLRKVSCSFFGNDFLNDLQKHLFEIGLTKKEFTLKSQDITDSDKDPLILELTYNSIIEKSAYLSDKVLIEIGSRSLIEPCDKRDIQSIIGEKISEQSFSGKPFKVLTVSPKRTFLEKAFLLHEEFSKPKDQIRNSRMSRHLYDLERLMDSEYGKEALLDVSLYKTIVTHRAKYTPIRGINYSNHNPDKINFVPPKELISEWFKDYKTMQNNMIYGESLSFEQLLDRMNELKNRFSQINLGL